MSDYQPREKIVARHVQTLSKHELVQAMIGSGGKQRSVRYIARRVVRLLKNIDTAPTYEMLCAIEGIGPAKASSFVAAFELAGRHARRTLYQPTAAFEPRHGLLYCRFCSPDGVIIDQRWYPAHLVEREGRFIQQLVATALVMHAVTLHVYDGVGEEGSLGRLQVFSRYHRLIAAAETVAIRVKEYYVIDSHHQPEAIHA